MASITDVPIAVFQFNVLSLFSSRDMFRLRGVCADWSDSIKIMWC